MKRYRILLSVGKDRPGIVDEVSTLLFERGANIEDSQMAVMGGCFSIMTLFSCSSEQLEEIGAALSHLKKVGLETSLHEAEDPTAAPTDPALPLKFEVTAMDHPGIVQKIVHILHQGKVNIRSLESHVTQAPFSGAPLFSLTLEAAVPAQKPILRLKEDLEKLALEMNMDLNFKK